MATREQTERALESLIAQGSQLRSIAIRGEWGCGKTFLVSSFFKSASGVTLLEKAGLTFVYVSLFGIGSLPELRRSISTKVVGVNAKHLVKNAKWIAEFVIPGSVLHGASVLAETASAVLEDKAVNNLVVCLDDMDRNESLPMGEVLGLISELIEQRNCRCVLICNSKKLPQAAQGTQAMFEEKVFDLVLEYKPTIEENIKHGITTKANQVAALDVFEAFGNSNIRIMRRLEWVMHQLDAEKPSRFEEVRETVVQHASAICILKYAHSAELPNLRILLEKGASLSNILGYSDVNGAVSEDIRGILDKVEYTPLEFDRYIFDLLDEGAFSPAAFRASIIRLITDTSAQTEAMNVRALWTSVRCGFSIKRDDFALRIENLLCSDLAHTSAEQQLGICNLWLQVDARPETTKKVKRIAAAQMRKVPIELRKGIAKEFVELAKLGLHESEPCEVPSISPQLSEVFEKVRGTMESTSSSWSPEKALLLDQFSDDDIEGFLLAYRSDYAITEFRRFLENLKSGHIPGDDAASRYARVVGIFRRIATKDELYAFKVKKLLEDSAR